MSDKDDLKNRLTPMQYSVTQDCGTEPPFQNEYWNNKKPGIYVDIVSGNPLFSSLDKFDSGTGWPSFTKPIEDDSIENKEDRSHFMYRIEVKGKLSGSHLGHVFDDGPGPDGKRYCINSAALRFIPVEDLEKEGYGRFLPLFKKSDKASSGRIEKAVFAAGCFWGVEGIIKSLKGVIKTEVGYTGGTTENPTYKQVSTGSTGHAEAILIEFNLKRV